VEVCPDGKELLLASLGRGLLMASFNPKVMASFTAKPFRNCQVPCLSPMTRVDPNEIVGIAYKRISPEISIAFSCEYNLKFQKQIRQTKNIKHL